MKQKFINTLLWILLWCCFTFRIVKTTDSFIDFATVYNLRTNVKQAIKRTTASIDYVYILFDDKKIGKYSDQLVQLSQCNIGKSLGSFGIYSQNQILEYYYGIQKAGAQILVINASTNSTLISNKTYKILKYIELLKFYTSTFYDMLIYNDDVFFRLSDTNGTLETLNSTNFSQNTSAKNTIDKVIRTDFNGYGYNIIFTVLNHVYLVEFNASSASLAPILSISKKVDLSLIQNLTLSSELIDNKEIVIVQFSNCQLYAFYVINGSQVPISIDIQSAVGTSVLRAIYPDPSLNGQRLFMFSDKSIKVNLTSNGYSYMSPVQSNFTLTNWTGAIILNTNYSFVYTVSFKKIYYFSASVTSNPISVNNQTISNGTSNGTNVTCQIQNCLLCTVDVSQCVICTNGYAEFNGSCYEVGNCSTSSCQICDDLDVCLRCFIGYSLDTTTQECMQPNNSVPNNSVPNNNQTPNITVNNTPILIYNNTSPQQYPIIDNITFTNQTTNQNQTIIANQSTNASVQPNISTPTIAQNTTTPSRQYQYTDTNEFSTDRMDETFNSFSPQIKHLNSLSSRVNSLPGARILLTFLNPLFGFFDDYWYYIYHQDSYPQLQILPQFLVFMYFANTDRIFPDSLNFDHTITLKQLTTSNYSTYTNPQVYQIDKQQTYFLGNLQQMLFQQYLLLAVVFVIIKCITMLLRYILRKNSKKKSGKKLQQKSKQTEKKHIDRWRLLKKLRKTNYLPPQQEQIKPQKNCTILNSITEYLQSFVSFKCILITLIGSNFIFIAFHFSAQIRMMFTFNKIDLGNIVSTLAGGFILIAFTCIVFLYQDVFSQSVKQQFMREPSHQTRKWKDQRRACFYLTYFRHIKSFAYGFVHGFFSYEPVIQYMLLIVIKIVLMYFIVSKNNIMRNSGIKVIVFAYFMAGIGVDLMCLLSKQMLIPDFFMKNIINDLNLINFLELIFIAIIVITLMAQLLIEIFLDVKNAFCYGTNNHKGNQRPRTIFMLLRQVVPLNLFDPKDKKSSNKKDFSGQNNQHQSSLSPKSTTNLNDQFISKLLFRLKSVDKDPNEQIKDTIQSNRYKSKLKFQKRNRLTPLNPTANFELKVKYSRETEFNNRQSQTQFVQSSMENNKTKSKFKSQKGNSPRPQVHIEPSFLDNSTAEDQSLGNTIVIHGPIQSNNFQPRPEHSKTQRVQAMLETNKYTMADRYKFRRKNAKDIENVRNVILIKEEENIQPF